MENQRLKKTVGRIVFDWMLLIGLYVPFVLFMMAEVPHLTNVQHGGSLSGIGWRFGFMGYLIFYILFMAGFLLYQALLLLKIRERKDWLHYVIFVLAIVGPVIMMLGAFMPTSGDGANYPISTNPVLYNLPLSVIYVTDFLHTVLTPIGTVLYGFCIGFMVFAIIRDIKSDAFGKLRILMPAVVILFFAVFGMLTLPHWVSAMFSVLMSFMVLVYLHYVVVSYELAVGE